MRCYQCDQPAPTLFPILKDEKAKKKSSIPITIYVCATCHKAIQKEQREGGQ